MKPGEYLLHSLKYLLKLLVLLVLIYLLLYFVGGAKVSAGQFVTELFSTARGKMLLGALLILAAVYPLFGFVRRTVAADMEADREKIVNAFHAAGYVMKEEQPGEKMVFRASGFKKVRMVWDDKVTVTVSEGNVVLEGIRRETVQVEFRLNTYIQNKHYED